MELITKKTLVLVGGRADAGPLEARALWEEARDEREARDAQASGR